MGAGSSVSGLELFPERGEGASGTSAWLNAEDVADLVQAKSEISRLRQLA